MNVEALWEEAFWNLNRVREHAAAGRAVEKDLHHEIAILADVLDALFNAQNGPPLLSQKDGWNKIMARATKALAMAQGFPVHAPELEFYEKGAGQCVKTICGTN